MLVSYRKPICGWLHGGQHFILFCKQSMYTRILWSVWEQSFNNLFLLFNPNELWMLKCKGGWSKAIKQCSCCLSLKATLLKTTGDACCRSNLIHVCKWQRLLMQQAAVQQRMPLPADTAGISLQLCSARQQSGDEKAESIPHLVQKQHCQSVGRTLLYSYQIISDLIPW